MKSTSETQDPWEQFVYLFGYIAFIRYRGLNPEKDEEITSGINDFNFFGVWPLLKWKLQIVPWNANLLFHWHDPVVSSVFVYPTGQKPQLKGGQTSFKSVGMSSSRFLFSAEREVTNKNWHSQGHCNYFIHGTSGTV